MPAVAVRHIYGILMATYLCAVLDTAQLFLPGEARFRREKFADMSDCMRWPVVTCVWTSEMVGGNVVIVKYETVTAFLVYASGKEVYFYNLRRFVEPCMRAQIRRPLANGAGFAPVFNYDTGGWKCAMLLAKKKLYYSDDVKYQSLDTAFKELVPYELRQQCLERQLEGGQLRSMQLYELAAQIRRTS